MKALVLVVLGLVIGSSEAMSKDRFKRSWGWGGWNGWGRPNQNSYATCPATGGYIMTGTCFNGVGCASNSVCWPPGPTGRACCALAVSPATATVVPTQTVVVVPQSCPFQNYAGECIQNQCGPLPGATLQCIQGVCCRMNGK